ncbi:MAG: cell division protein FtsJ [Thermobacillus sp. ZCTH02-B1]|uniref:cyclic-phosphate processing receiver domain-containing protein n=1 Tax=Thermobacillus sp. ZCTH02-B1 TaxID=1858795 RepID=UPI000B5773CF|nr:cyclic-phosphate processing receiver domain-containing protein [Thermobacillus sp. ZCTH02-B1]OUM96684.1 MAG: cell division protein FtsJ [Thermobacillus sp. ZCTH02-B1]
MIHVYLDDHRTCPPGFVAARSAEECILLLEAEEVDILSLDYDLGWGRPTGLEVARYIAESGRYPRRIYMHSSSPSGRMRMYEMLRSALPPDVHLSHTPMPDDVAAEAAGGRA